MLLFKFGRKSLQLDPRRITSLFIGLRRVRLLAASHKTVRGTLVGYNLVEFAGCLHLLLRLREGSVDARIRSCIEAVDRRLNGSYGCRFGSAAIEYECGDKSLRLAAKRNAWLPPHEKPTTQTFPLQADRRLQ